jgi:sulfonate transport system substrate-binding protein
MKKSILGVIAISAVAALGLSGCAAGENATQEPAATADAADWGTDTLNIDWATYNPLSLIIKDQGWLEDELGSDVTVNWVQSLGSSKANEFLRAGSIDVGSTAGSAALLARSNGSPIKTIDVYSQPNWSAILVPADSDIESIDDLKGHTIAAATATDPYFFLLQALEEAGLSSDDVTIENLLHPDGKAALESGAVDAWSGLDPLLSTSVESGASKIIYDNIDFNSYGFLNATESFIEKSPKLAQLVVDAYEKARAYAIANPEEAAQILADAAEIELPVATAVLTDRTNLEIDPIPGQTQTDVLTVIGPIFVSNGDVASQDLIDTALNSLYDTQFAEKADPDAIG